MWSSGYIFWSKVDELLDGIKDVNLYIENIMVLIKDIFTEHIGHIIVILDNMSNI